MGVCAGELEAYAMELREVWADAQAMCRTFEAGPAGWRGPPMSSDVIQLKKQWFKMR